MIGEGGDQIKSVSSFAAGVTDFPLDSENDAHERLLNFLVREDNAAYIRNGSTTLDANTRTNATSSFSTVVAATGTIGGIHPFTIGSSEKTFVQSKDSLFLNTTGSTWGALQLFKISTGPDVYKSLLFVDEDKVRQTPSGSEITFSETFVDKKLIQGFNNTAETFCLPTVLSDSEGTANYTTAGLPIPNVERDIDGIAEYVTKFNAVLASFSDHISNATSPAPHGFASAALTIPSITVSTTIETMELYLRRLCDAYEQHILELTTKGLTLSNHLIKGYLSFRLGVMGWGNLYALTENLNTLYTAISLHYMDFGVTPFSGTDKVIFVHNTASSLSNMGFVSSSTKKYYFSVLVKNKSSFLIPQTISNGADVFFSSMFGAGGVLQGHVASLGSSHSATLIDATNNITWFSNQYYDGSLNSDKGSFARFVASSILASVLWSTHVASGTMYHAASSEPTPYTTPFKLSEDTGASPIATLPSFYDLAFFNLVLDELKSISSTGSANRFDLHNVSPRHTSPSAAFFSTEARNIQTLHSTFAYTISKTINGVAYESTPYYNQHPCCFVMSTPVVSLGIFFYDGSSGSFFPAINTNATPTFLDSTFFFGIDGCQFNTYYLDVDGVYKKIVYTTPPDAAQTVKSFINMDSLESLYTSGGAPDEGAMPPAKIMFRANNCMFVANTMEWERPLDSLNPRFVNYPRRIRQSLQNFPEAFPGTFYTDLPEDIICGASAKDRPVLVTTRGVYRVDGVIPDDGSGNLSYEQIYDRVGGVSHTGAISCNNVVFFAGTDGFYMTDGYQVQPISENLKISYSLIDKHKIRAAYNRGENSIYWAISHSGVYDEIWVLNLEKPITEKSCFTKLGGSSNFRPTAIAFTDESELLRGDEDGWVFIHGSSYLADPRVNRNTGALERNSSSELLTAHIPFDLASAFFSFGSTRLRKYVTDWDITVENINPRTDDRQSFSIQPYYNNDKGRIAEGLSSYVAMKPIAYIDPPPGLVEIKRKFSAGSLRCLYKQLGFRNASVLLADFDEINDPQPPANITGKVTITAVSPTVWTATLNSGYNFPVSDLQGCELYLEYDGYTTAFTITDANDGADADTKPDTLVITHPSATPPTGGANMQKWKIRGYPKTERFAVIGYNIPFHTMSSTKDVQVSGRS